MIIYFIKNKQLLLNYSTTIKKEMHRVKPASKNRDFPFHVEVKSQNLTGFIMTEQIKSIDYNARKVRFVEKVDKKILNKVLGITKSVIF